MKIHKGAVACQSQDTLQNVAAILFDKKLRHIYVVDKEKLVGIVSYADIVKSVADGIVASSVRAGEIMANVASAKDGEIEKAYAIMRNFSTLLCPVTDDGMLVGYYRFDEVCDALHKKVIGNGAH